MRFLLTSALLLCAAGVWAQQVPTRPLLGEMTRAEQAGIPASVHTRFALGNGLLLDGDTVLVARHALLTPGGTIEGEIDVGTSRPPLNNIMELHSVAIAQDPEHDLVLLRLLGDGAPGGVPALATLPAGQSCGCAPRAVRARARSHRARRKGRAGRTAIARLMGARTSAGEPVRLHVVWDGPLRSAR